jgi:hypothetical protein
MTTRKIPAKFHTQSLALTEETTDILARLGQDLTDASGRKVSGSAVIRALLRYAGQQSYRWGIAELLPLVERELEEGTRWGKKA